MSRLPTLPLIEPALVDGYGRVHNNLRISVTDRCNLRCTYCMPEEVVFLDRSELLTFEEIAHFVAVAVSLGVDKVRLTGGEPLLRRDLPKLVALLAPNPGLRDIGLTTNGILLAQQAQDLYDAGLRRLNVSLDTLDPQRFREITRRGGLDKVLAGLEAAQRVGFERIKINAVSIRGITDLDAVPLARFARENGYEMRFIEYMPIGADSWEREKVFFAREILELLEEEFGPVVPASRTTTRMLPPWISSTRTAAGASALSRRSRARSAAVAIASDSPPKGNSATACSPSTKSTSSRSCVK